ncbi:VWA domain-containing protein [Alteromonas sp. a30]|uniref:VWA domain-containing protein n=1 Tax=Alteromonas sp. a30 TaxID=2730917 RepID=UPI0022826228|nr:VWA domain-containing protein [Alteromonas sp. a30]MCY7295871.1 tetratricopeptide repeat protein [Alteromonas sp. a30]
MPFDLQDFHFIRPLWLLAIVPLLFVVLSLRHIQKQQSGWQGVIANHLYARLISVQGGKTRKPPLHLLVLGWVITCLALAGPTWERLPQPVYQLHTGKVVIIDMTLSMRATDVKPDRLSRAKFKAIDLVTQAGEGEIGLIAYAGDAFVISPLSTDIQNLTSLIPSLAPEIMPTPGSEPLYAFEEAIELLGNSGYQKGEIFWITDGVELSQIAPITKLISQHDYRVSILGIGTEEGAPIQLANKELLKDGSGAIVVPKLNNDPLKTIARKGQGKYVDMQANDDDIVYLTEQNLLERETQEQGSEEDNNFGDQWKEMGPYLVLLLLPFAAYAFRRGILVVLLCALLPSLPKPAHAGWWEDLWQRPDQQGMKAFNQENFAEASEHFKDPMWKGSAAYREGDFESAAEHFSQLDTAEAHYNRGNALAKAGQLDEAIKAYEKTLEQQPDHTDAAKNKALLEQLKQQQEQNQDQQNQNKDNQEQNSDDQESEEQDSQNQNSQNKDSESQSGKDNQEQDNQNNQDQQQEQQSDSEQEQSDQQDESQQSQQEEQEKSEEEQQSDENQSSQEQDAEAEEQEQQGTTPPVSAQNEELTDEEKEELQKMQTLLRKIPDDPAYLLKRKMLLEKQRRRTQRLPSNTGRNW